MLEHHVYFQMRTDQIVNTKKQLRKKRHLVYENKKVLQSILLNPAQFFEQAPFFC